MTPPAADESGLMEHVIKAAPIYGTVGTIMAGAIFLLGKMLGRQFVETLATARAEMEANTKATAELTTELQVIKAGLPAIVADIWRHNHELDKLHAASTEHEGRISWIEGNRPDRRKGG
jgi:hypothetical protein